jgi:hypothetical protein
MGWTSYHIDRTETTDSALRREMTQRGTDGASWDIVDSATVGATWYAIARRTLPTGEALHYGLVCLTERRNFGRRFTEFNYKDMTEDCGPFYYDAPLRILDKLDELAPNPAPAAAAWRAQCRERRAAKAAKERQRREMRAQLAKYIPQQFKEATHANPTN